MQHMKKLLLLQICLCIFVATRAQKIDPAETFNDAYTYFQSNDFEEAYAGFSQLRTAGYGNANISYYSGMCLLHMPGKVKAAITAFEEAAKNTSSGWKEGDPEESGAPLQDLFHLAQAYRMNGQPDQCEATLTNLLSQVDTTTDKRSLRLIQHELEYCKNAAELTRLPVTFKMVNPGPAINSSMNETSPAVTPSESLLVFVSEKKFYDAIEESGSANHQWGALQELTSQLGSDGEFRVTAISADGTKMLLTSYDILSSNDIFESVYRDGKWSKCRKLGQNINSPYSENFASYSPDGRSLYFTSNRPLGHGGYDIYCSKADSSGNWGPAFNLGPEINSEYDEASPMMADDGQSLFFSSMGHFSMGGYDIFCSKLMDGKFTYAQNIGFPVNNYTDNTNWVPVAGGKAGWCSIYDPSGQGGFDLVRIEAGNLPNLSRFTVNGSVTGAAMAATDTTVFMISITAKENGKIQEWHSSSGKHDFAFREPAGTYQLLASANGYHSREYTFAFTREQVDPGWNSAITLEKTEAPVRNIFHYRNILFSFNSSDPGPAYSGFLDSLADLMARIVDIRIEITGFTDHIGSARYNQQLSLRRANAIKQYLVVKHINASRISVLGLGESSPLAAETDKYGKDIAEGRKWNRRVQFTLTGTDEWVLKDESPAIPPELRSGKK